MSGTQNAKQTASCEILYIVLPYKPNKKKNILKSYIKHHTLIHFAVLYLRYGLSHTCVLDAHYRNFCARPLLQSEPKCVATRLPICENLSEKRTKKKKIKQKTITLVSLLTPNNKGSL